MNDNTWQDLQWRPERIHALREGLNRSQEEMATLIGVTQRTIFRWEKGECLPRHRMIRRLKKLEGKLITEKLKEKERLARLLEKGERETPSEYQQIRETIQEKRLIARAEMDVVLRGAHKAFENSWKVLKQTTK